MKKWIIVVLLCSIVVSGCMPKRNCKVIIVRSGESERDTIEVKTTAYYPHFTLRNGSPYLEVKEPLPIMPWKSRIRKIWVGDNQIGYHLLRY